MGKASSAKKVARAARAGGKTSRRERPKLAFPLAVFVIIVLGTLMVVWARGTKTDAVAETVAPSSKNADHWHAAYGVYVCDKFLPPLQDVGEDKLGIHTHGEGVMHVHPFTSAASGDKARLKVFGDQVKLTFLDDGIRLPDGTEYRNGTAKCGDKPAKVAIYRWADATTHPDSAVEVFESGFGDIRYREDRDAYTIAVVPQDMTDAPPKPDSVAELDKLTDVDNAGTQGLPPGAIPTDPTASLPPGAIPTDPTASLPPGAIPTDPTASTPGAVPSDPTASTPGAVTPPASDPAANTPAPSTPAS